MVFIWGVLTPFHAQGFSDNLATKLINNLCFKKLADFFLILALFQNLLKCQCCYFSVKTILKNIYKYQIIYQLIMLPTVRRYFLVFSLRKNVPTNLMRFCRKKTGFSEIQFILLWCFCSCSFYYVTYVIVFVSKLLSFYV